MATMEGVGVVSDSCSLYNNVYSAVKRNFCSNGIASLVWSADASSSLHGGVLLVT